MDMGTLAVLGAAVMVGAPLWILFIDRVLDAIHER